MNIVFMGTPSFALQSLDLLVKEKYNVLAVITQPDKPRGRGNKVIFSDIKKYALENNIEVLQPNTLRNNEEFVNKLKSMNPDLFVTAAYGKILTQEVLSIPKYGCINVHASILPKYRGAAPIHWAIIKGEKKTGVTTMMTDIGMDTGDILIIKEIEIDNDDTVSTLHDKLANLGRIVLKETLDKMKNKSLERIQQNNEEATYAPIIKKDLGAIKWDNSANDIYNLIRGTNPWPGAYTFYMGDRMRIWKSEIVKEACTTSKPGTILGVTKEGIYVATKDNIINIVEVQFDSCRKMCIDQYICGHEICEGEVFGE